MTESTFKWGVEGAHCPYLRDLTTLEVGGQPRWYASVTHEEKAQEISRWALTHDVPLWVIGGGSNVLCTENNLQGMILQLSLNECSWSEPHQNHIHVTVGAGVIWNDLVEESIHRNLTGIECLIGIPGWVGAAPIQNIGAYGQELSDVCVAVRVYDRQQDEVRWWSTAECEFAYRQSRFKREKGRYLIFAVQLKLAIDQPPIIRYEQLQHVLSQSETVPDLITVSTTVKKLRAAKSMLLDPQDPNRRSVGSFFLNPLVDFQTFLEIDQRSRQQGYGSPPSWPVEANRRSDDTPSLVKLSAAWLIEHAGIKRGYRKNQVGISSAHTLALVNLGGAKADEVIELACEVQRRVWRAWRVWLVPEVQLITDDALFNPFRFRPRIALVSCHHLPHYEVDDHPLWNTLKSHDVDLMLPVWDDPEFDWSACDLVIPRTTWDYQGRWTEFLAWMKRVDQESFLLNPLSLMQWNLDKRYLRDLTISQPPTLWIEERSLDHEDQIQAVTQEVLDYCAQAGWERAFLKPNIAASAIGTLRFSPHHNEDQLLLATHLAEWLPKRTMLLQPYLDEVEVQGECSLIYFNGEYSHGVRKIPVSGDYRVQDDYGASDIPWQPPQTWKLQCEVLLQSLPVTPLYARCDFLSSPDGSPWLIELELIEPSLFFRHDAQAPERFTQAILARCPQPSRMISELK